MKTSNQPQPTEKTDTQGTKVKPLNDFVLVRKCINDHIRNESGDVVIYRTDHGFEQTNWAEILDIGPKCSETMKSMKGFMVQCPEHTNGLHFVGDDCWVVREHLLNRKELAGIAIKYD